MKIPLPVDLEDLTPATINQIVWDIRDGTADPEEARRLLRLYCWYQQTLQVPPKVLSDHFREAFEAILDKSKSPDKALGLTRKKGRTKANAQIRSEMAHYLLKLRLIEGHSHQEALELTAEKFGWGISVIGEAWAQHKQDAIVLERLTRALDNYPWTEAEVIKLTEMFGHEGWFDTPGKS